VIAIIPIYTQLFGYINAPGLQVVLFLNYDECPLAAQPSFDTKIINGNRHSLDETVYFAVQIQHKLRGNS
jgi:hypothetical protein